MTAGHTSAFTPHHALGDWLYNPSILTRAAIGDAGSATVHIDNVALYFIGGNGTYAFDDRSFSLRFARELVDRMLRNMVPLRAMLHEQVRDHFGSGATTKLFADFRAALTREAPACIRVDVDIGIASEARVRHG